MSYRNFGRYEEARAIHQKVLEKHKALLLTGRTI
ncbi:MAG: hypothetical protein LBR61_09520 [Synergistaceae bacterium]|nr:hypothetical protein [Synergistaceae bacterium]